MLFTLQNFNHCSTGNQLCIIVLDNLKTMFDVVDIVTLQRFVMSEFRQRRQYVKSLIRQNQERGDSKIIKPYQMDHENMHSAQVNQMTLQLKEKLENI